MVAANFVFCFFLLLPFQFAIASMGGSDIPLVRIIIPILFLGWALHGFATKKIILPKALTFFAISGFLAWALLSISWAENPSWALRKGVFWLNLFPLFFVLISVFKNKRVRKSAFQGLIWGACLVAGVGVMQFLTQFFVPLPVLVDAYLKSLHFFLGSNFATAVASYPSILVNMGGVTILRAFAFFPDPHIFAYYCGMVLPLALYNSFQKKPSLFTVLIPVILFLAILLSFSRASYIALLVTALIFLVYFFWQYKKNLSIVAVLFIANILIALLISPITERFMTSFSQEDGSVTERSRLWQEAVVNIQEAPLQGVGLGNYPLLVKPSAEPREPIYVHNLYLDLSVELGLVGLLLFLVFILSCLPMIPIFSQNSFSHTLALYASLIIFLVHSIFEYPLFSIHILILFLTILSFLYVEKK